MKKFLFLVSCDYLIYDKIADENHIVKQMFRPIRSRFMKMLRRIHYMSRLPMFELWYNNFEDVDFSNIDCVIVSARRYADVIYKMIRKRSNAKIVFWYSNPLKQEGVNLADLGIPKDIIYSFDVADCEEYGFQYNPQFYTESMQLPEKQVMYDVLFVGKDKGRLRQLQAIEKYLNDCNLKTLFYIVSSDETQIKKGYKPYISYGELLSYIAQSSVIMDFNQEGQSGLTWRPLEALFFEKKLITNNEFIKNERVFDPRNVSICDYENFSIDPEWILSPYEPRNDDAKEYYSFTKWAERFLSNSGR